MCTVEKTKGKPYGFIRVKQCPPSQPLPAPIHALKAASTPPETTATRAKLPHPHLSYLGLSRAASRSEEHTS